MSFAVKVPLVRNPIANKGISGYTKMVPAKLYPVGYYTSSVMPMTLIRPCLNTGVGTYNPDYYGYVGRETQIRITIQGGAYPFVATIKNAPAGATINNDPMADDYMVLKFTPTANGVQRLVIDVHDQEQTMVRINYDFTTSVNWCVFCSPTGSNTTGNGTKANPWKTINHAMNVTTGGQCLILEDGTYTDTALGADFRTTSCNSIITWNHNHNAIIDLVSNVETETGALFYISSSNMIAQGLTISNPVTTIANPKIFSALALVDNIHVDNCVFNINGRLGALNNDNVSCFFLSNPGLIQRRNISLTRSIFDGLAGAGNGWSAIDTYQCTKVVIAKNRFRNQVSSTVSAGTIWIKGTGSSFVDIYQNQFETTHHGCIVDIYLANNNADNVTGSVDVAYNVVRCSGRNGIGIVRSSQDGARLPVWTRRNTIIGGMITIYKRSFAVTFTSDSDVIQSTEITTEPWKISVADSNDGQGIHRPLSWMPSLTYNISKYECHQTSGVVDSSGNLIGPYASFIGQRGHVIQKP